MYRPSENRPISRPRSNFAVDWYDPRGELNAKGLLRLGATFARLRNSRGFSQGALADRIGVSQPSISRFETGKQPGFAARWLGRMMVVLEISSDELEEYAQRPGPRPTGYVDWATLYTEAYREEEGLTEDELE